MRFLLNSPALQPLWTHFGQLRFSSAGIAQSVGEGTPPLSFYENPHLVAPFFDKTRRLESALDPAAAFKGPIEPGSGHRFLDYEQNVLRSDDSDDQGGQDGPNGTTNGAVVMSRFLHLRVTASGLSPLGTSYSFFQLALPGMPVCTNLNMGSRDLRTELMVDQNVVSHGADDYSLEMLVDVVTLRSALESLGIVGHEPSLWRIALRFSQALAADDPGLFSDGFLVDGSGPNSQRRPLLVRPHELAAVLDGAPPSFAAPETNRKWKLRTAGSPYIVQQEGRPLFSVEASGNNAHFHFLRTRRTSLAAPFARLFDHLLTNQAEEARRGTVP